MGDSKKEGLYQEQASNFVQQINILAERKPESRPLLLRTLAKFAGVPAYNLGELCLANLASLANRDKDGMDQVMKVIYELVVPQLVEVVTQGEDDKEKEKETKKQKAREKKKKKKKKKPGKKKKKKKKKKK